MRAVVDQPYICIEFLHRIPASNSCIEFLHRIRGSERHFGAPEDGSYTVTATEDNLSNHRIQNTSLAAILSISLAALAALLLPASATAVIDLEGVNLIVLDTFFDGEDTGWIFEVEVEGSGITSATYAPPGKTAIALSQDGPTEWEFESMTFGSSAP